MDELDEATETALAASRALLGIIAASLEPVQARGVTIPQFRILALLLALGPTRTGALAERIGVHPSTFSRTGDRLVTAGLMRRVGNPESRREVLVQLTPAGRRLVQSVWRRRAAELRQILEPLPPEQRQVIVDGFAAFAVAAGEPEPDELSTVLGA
jgi:DNA-binding MarR family transcriptional regulator